MVNSYFFIVISVYCDSLNQLRLRLIRKKTEPIFSLYPFKGPHLCSLVRASKNVGTALLHGMVCLAWRGFHSTFSRSHHVVLHND
ncbi:hypothetical protein Hanom_Chr03g00242801 [Helianthus anomalus]